MVTAVKSKFGYDDSLDAFGVHGAGGTLGAILTGVFATKEINDVLVRQGAGLGGRQRGASAQPADRRARSPWVLPIVGTLIILKDLRSDRGRSARRPSSRKSKASI